jgi:hypothetical protein
MRTRSSQRIATEKPPAAGHPAKESRLIHQMKTETYFMDNSSYPPLYAAIARLAGR